MNQFLIVALGNPGEQFMHTRHNLGQDVVTRWIASVEEQGASVKAMQSKESLHARIQEILFHNQNIVVVFPDVFMNESGKAVAQYLRYHEIARQNILVVHDDLEVPLGEVKYQEAGSAHGHNGVRSIHEYLGDTNMPQLRIGIGRPQSAIPIEKFVLAQFTEEEKKTLQEKESLFIKSISDIISQRLPQG